MYFGFLFLCDFFLKKKKQQQQKQKRKQNKKVVHNPYVAGDHLPISSLMKLDFWGTPTSSSLSHKSFRPLCSLLYRFLWRIRVSDSPAMVFHLAEVVLNAVCSALAVLLVIGPLCKTAPLTKIIASLLYAVHPAKTEAVAGVVGMAEILSALFFFAAVYLFSEKQSVILAGLSCFLASMCKETGVTSALVVAVIGFSRRRYIGSVVVVAIAVTMFVMTRVVAFGRDSWTIEPSPQDNPMMMHRGLLYLINAAWVQTKYIQILFWPANLTCDYSFNAMPLITSLGDVRILVAVIASSGVAWLLWRAVVKGDRPLLFASAWYVAPMLPATHLVGVIGTLVAERLLYVPALGWALLVGEGCRRAVRKQPVLAKIIVLVLLVACCGALGARTVERNADWKNNDVLFDRTLAVVPNSLKAIMNIAGRSFVAADWKNVLVMTDRAMQVDPKYCHAMQIKGRALLELADDPKAALPVLMQCYDCMRVKRHSSQLMAEVLELIGKSHMTMKNYEEAIPWFRKGIETGKKRLGRANIRFVFVLFKKRIITRLSGR